MEHIDSIEQIDDEMGRHLVAFLASLIDDLRQSGSSFEEVADALRSVIGRMDSLSSLAAVTDWWLVCVTGGAPVTPGAFSPPSSVPPEVARVMTAVLTSGVPAPIADSLRDRRVYGALLAQLDHDMVLDHHGQLRMPQSQRQVWTNFMEDVSAHVASVGDQRVYDSPLPEVKRFRSHLKEAAIAANSSIWNEMVELFTTVTAELDELRRLVDGLSSWTHITPTSPLIEVPAPWRTGSFELERWLLTPIVMDDDAPRRPMNESELIALVRHEAEALTGPSLTRLAMMIEEWSGRHSLKVSDLDRALSRLSELRKRRARLERKDHDLGEVWLHLVVDHDLDATERAFDEFERTIADSDRARSLRQQVVALEQRVQAASSGDAHMPAISNAYALINRGDLDAAQVTIVDLERAMVRGAVEDLRQTVDFLRDDLERLIDDDGYLADAVALARDMLGELDEWVDRLAVPGTSPSFRELQAAQDELRSKVADSLRRFREDLDVAVVALTRGATALSSVLDAETEADLGRQIAELRGVVDDLSEPVQIDDLVSAIDDLKVVSEQVELLRRDRWVDRWTFERGEQDLVDHVLDYCTQQLAFDEDDVIRLYVAIKSKPFVVLSGLTGSGKSTIARLIAESLGASAQDNTFRRIAVRPDWIDQSEVLGYVNPIRNEFRPGWLADVVRDCNRNPGRLYFVLLDEMNLAPVEQYLAEYLSAGEERRSGSSDVRLSLYPRGTTVENAAEWESDLRFPDNLVVIGTVNVDETTRVLSDRVIDRANVLQLATGVTDEHHSPRQGDVRPWVVPFDEWRRTYPTTPPDRFHHNLLVHVAEVMEQRMRIGLGVRAHVEIERYVQHAAGIIEPTTALDEAIIQRLIPKIRGYKRDLAGGLDALAALFDEHDLVRSAAVVRDWLAEHLSDDYFVDGMQARVGSHLVR